MKDTEVLERLDTTGIHREQDFAVPINGVSVKLPYMVVRREENITGSDNGKVRMVKINWTIALFSANQAPELERQIFTALSGAGKVEINRYPDGKPYQTNFEFTTNQILK